LLFLTTKKTKNKESVFFLTKKQKLKIREPLIFLTKQKQKKRIVAFLIKKTKN
jgi:hypothetical protein